MTPVRSTLVALVAAILLAGVGPMQGFEEQYPHGLMSGSSLKGCTIETRPLSFGTYDPLGTTFLDGQGQVIYTCGIKLIGNIEQAVTNIRIEISRGGAASYDRRMTSSDSQLNYNVYLDSSHRTVWGDGSSGTNYYFDSAPPRGTPVTATVYGRIPGMQDIAAGQYSDILQVTILF